MLTDFQIITQDNNYISLSPLWLRENFSEIIIFKNFDAQSLPYYPQRNLPKNVIDDFSTEILTPRIIHPNQDALNTSSAILSILLKANIRRGSLTTLEPYLHTFLSKINYFVERSEPIQIVLPTIPHKKQSPLTTGHSMDFVDLGEYLLMSQLRNILLSVEKIYNPGAKITLLSDGILLADIFTNNDKSLIHNYMQKLNDLKNQFNLNGLVNIEGLDNLIKDRELFAQVHDDIKRLLYTLYKKDVLITQGLDILKKAMLVFNLPFDHSLEEHFFLMKIPLHKIPYNIRALVEYATVDYVSTLLALKKLDIIKMSYPHAIRASVHDKPTPNFPLNLINKKTSIFPYNGIPVVRRGKYERTQNIQSSTKIIRLYEIYKYPSATEIFIDGQDEPFYYEIDSLNE